MRSQPPPEPLERLLTPDEASELLGVAKATLYRWSYMRRHGQKVGPEVVRLERGIRYRPQAIREYLQARAS